MENEYKVAIYCRLSQEDRRKYNDIDESESIQNQKAMLLSYVKKNKWRLYDIYWDDDYSGMDANRPDWNRLLNDAKNNKFDIILCKTQSRFTRDMEMVEKYLNYKFNLWGIRFITTVDNVDTSIKGSKKARQINGLTNQWYVEDTSESVKSALHIMRELGKYIASTPLYGYIRDSNDKGKIIINPEPAEVVKRIYDMYYYQNLGCCSIAKVLNNEGILPPAMYKKEKLISTYNHHNMTEVWKEHTVRNILKNRMYTGDMVQGTTTKPDIKCKRTIQVPKEKWVIVENTHEPIISKELYENVQEKFKDKHLYSNNFNRSYLFAGKLKCLNCNSSMQLRRCHGVTPYYRCKHSFEPVKKCSNEYRIQYENLYNVILYAIKEKIDKYCNFSKVENELKSRNYASSIDELKNTKDKVICLIQKKSKYLNKIYENLVDNLITRSEYRSFKEKYQIEIEELNRKLEKINRLIEKMENSNEQEDCIKNMMKKFQNITTLDKNILNSFVNMIKIGRIQGIENEKQIIEIYWNF